MKCQLSAGVEIISITAKGADRYRLTFECQQLALGDTLVPGDAVQLGACGPLLLVGLLRGALHHGQRALQPLALGALLGPPSLLLARALVGCLARLGQTRQLDPHLGKLVLAALWGPREASSPHPCCILTHVSPDRAISDPPVARRSSSVNRGRPYPGRWPVSPGPTAPGSAWRTAPRCPWRASHSPAENGEVMVSRGGARQGPRAPSTCLLLAQRQLAAVAALVGLGQLEGQVGGVRRALLQVRQQAAHLLLQLLLEARLLGQLVALDLKDRRGGSSGGGVVVVGWDGLRFTSISCARSWSRCSNTLTCCSSSALVAAALASRSLSVVTSWVSFSRSLARPSRVLASMPKLRGRGQ